MGRTILKVDAFVVDANGTFNNISTYPRRFDSNSYDGDLAGTMKRAKADYYNVLGSMYANQAGRQIQTVILSNVHGDVILRESIGDFIIEEPVVEEPEGESEPEPEPDTEG